MSLERRWEVVGIKLGDGADRFWWLIECEVWRNKSGWLTGHGTEQLGEWWCFCRDYCSRVTVFQTLAWLTLPACMSLLRCHLHILVFPNQLKTTLHLHFPSHCTFLSRAYPHLAYSNFAYQFPLLSSRMDTLWGHLLLSVLFTDFGSLCLKHYLTCKLSINICCICEWMNGWMNGRILGKGIEKCYREAYQTAQGKHLLDA